VAPHAIKSVHAQHALPLGPDAEVAVVAHEAVVSKQLHAKRKQCAPHPVAHGLRTQDPLRFELFAMFG
jgi:hypothetical protein